jgi:RNA polymerase sigma-70 factor, ECF subfamily
MIVAMSDTGSDTGAESEDEILGRRARSEAAAFAELYERYLQPVHRFVRSQVPDHATAEDLTAQVFLKTFASASTYRGEGSYRSWIFQIARNTITTWKMKRPGIEVPVDEIRDPTPIDLAPAPTALPEERDVVRDTVNSLPDAQQEVIRLRYWRDLSIDEIADRTRRSPGAVRQLLHRARRRLERKLTGKEVGAIAGATGASAIAIYSITKHRITKHRRNKK